MYSSRLCPLTATIVLLIAAQWQDVLADVNKSRHNASEFIPAVQHLGLLGPGAVHSAVTVDGAQGRVYPWDKTVFTPEEYHTSYYCGNTCSGNTKVVKGSADCLSVHCFDCSCDRPKCEIYGTCCPTVDPVGAGSNPSRSDTNKAERRTTSASLSPGQAAIQAKVSRTDKSESPVTEVEHPVAKCGSDDFLYVQSCPADYSVARVRELCEQAHGHREDITVDAYARVSDPETGVTYYNKYCASCNGVSKMIPWEVKVECEHYMRVYNATTFDQLLSNSLRPGSSCQVKQVPTTANKTYCEREWFSKEPVGSCNVTGQWSKYDQDVEKACLEMEGRGFNVFMETGQRSRKLFKNIFCAICNMEDFPNCVAPRNQQGPTFGLFSSKASFLNPSLSLKGQDHIDGARPMSVLFQKPRVPPFSLILGFGRGRRRAVPVYRSPFTFSSCAGGEWSSPDGSCMKVYCAPGKVLDNQTCTAALDQICGLGYRFDLLFDLSDESGSTVNSTADLSPLFDAAVANLSNKMEAALRGLVDGYRVNFTIVDLNTRESSDRFNNPSRYTSQPLFTLWIDVALTASENISRDEFEANLMELVDKFKSDEVDMTDQNAQLRFIPRIFLQESSPIQRYMSRDALVLSSTFESLGKRTSVFDYSDFFLDASKVLNCPHVQFSNLYHGIEIRRRNFTTATQNNVRLQLGTTAADFSESAELDQFFLGKKQVLSVCIDVLNSKIKDMDTSLRQEFNERHFRPEANTISKAQYYLTIVCLSVSMVCLVLTLVTYFRFSALRNQAGRNNMSMCGSLLLAQVFLLASSHTSGPNNLCTALGVLTHFLWLWMFSWSFICCFHMFRVFSSKTRRYQTCSFACTTALSVVFPCLIVCIVLGSSLLTSGGDRTGYGHSSCYLDTPLLVGVSTVLPVALVTTSNAAFFVVTAAKIHSARKLQSGDSLKKSDRDNIYIYVKLSAMTGAFWFIQILAEALDVDALRFLAIIANGLQGVFIFVSYICNKRVLNLYLSSLGLEPVTLTSSETWRKVLTRHAGQQSGGVSSVEGQRSFTTNGLSSDQSSIDNFDEIPKSGNTDEGGEEIRPGPVQFSNGQHIISRC